MKANFTKGPWAKDKRGESLVSPDGDNVIVWSCGLSSSSKTDERVANSHLIAAGPDMYAMIELLVSELNSAIDEVNTMRDIHHMDAMTPADHWDKESCHDGQVLLAKARGEQ